MFLFKYGLIDQNNYCNVYYYTHTQHNYMYRLNACTKFDINKDQAVLKKTKFITFHFYVNIYTFLEKSELKLQCIMYYGMLCRMIIQ